MKHPTPNVVAAIADKAFEVRRYCLEMITAAGWGHLGGSLSQAELLSCLYTGILRIDPKEPQAPQRDRFILSKAHSSPALYATLALSGFFPVERLFTYCRIGGIDGHTQRGQCPGVEFSGGSLGTGLSYAAGIALGLSYTENFAARVYCLLGDGECNEGQIWEAAMAAAHYRLDNLIAIIDHNKVMAKGKVAELMSVEPLAAKFASFGWTVLECDGHDAEEFWVACYRAKYLEMRGRPVAIIAHTVKGRGLPDAEFNYHWHTHAPSPNQAARFLSDLNRSYDRAVAFSHPPSPPKDGGIEAVVASDLDPSAL
jgi:transketolase